jgi:thiol-disulfide isomerase/thioredoxin
MMRNYPQVIGALLLLGVTPQAARAQPATGFVTLIDEYARADGLHPLYQDEFHDVVRPRPERDSTTGCSLPLRFPARHSLLLQLSKGMEQYLVYARPGDTICVRTHPNETPYYTFHGLPHSPPQRAGELNFFTTLQLRGVGMGLPDALGALPGARFARQEPRFRALRDQRLALLRHLTDSLALSPDFVRFASQRIHIQYLQALLHPYWDKSHAFRELPAAYVHRLDSLGTSLLLTSDSLVRTSTQYRGAVAGYVRFLGRDSLDTPAELPLLYRQACTALRGRTRDYALFEMLKTSLGRHLPQYATYYARFRRDCATPAYVRYLDSVAARPATLLQRPALLRTPLLSSTGATLTLEQLLANNRGQILYVDLWASWCGPCLAEMPASAALQNTPVGRQVRFIYISVDSSPEPWRKAIAAHQLARPGTQHYLLSRDSELARFLNAPPIPRYLLFNKQGQAVSLDAARPSEPVLLTDLAELR